MELEVTMDNIHILKPMQKDEEISLGEACDWIAKIDRGLSETETLDFQKWIYAKPSNLPQMLKTAKIWDKMDDLERLSDIFPQNQVKRKKTSMTWAALAASVVLAFSLVLYNVSDMFYNKPQIVVSQAIESTYQTKIGEIDTITLPDNSVLVLNTNTIVHMKYTNDARVLELQKGEIHIDVAHDNSRPLSVLANGKMMQAVGTSFNVEVTADLVELIVTDGKVLVENKSTNQFKADLANHKIKLPHSSLAVSKGEKIDLDNDEKPKNVKKVIKLTSIDIMSSLSWQERKLIFRGESLAYVINEISRYTDLKIELENDEKLKKINVVGVFKTGDVTELLVEFEKHFNITHEKTSENKIKLFFAS